jgi:hypothetical protein
MPTSKELTWLNPDFKKYLKKKAIDKGKNLLDLMPCDIDMSIPSFDYNDMKPKKKKSVFEFKL